VHFQPRGFQRCQPCQSAGASGIGHDSFRLCLLAVEQAEWLAWQRHCATRPAACCQGRAGPAAGRVRDGCLLCVLRHARSARIPLELLQHGPSARRATAPRTSGRKPACGAVESRSHDARIIPSCAKPVHMDVLIPEGVAISSSFVSADAPSGAQKTKPAPGSRFEGATLYLDSDAGCIPSALHPKPTGPGASLSTQIVPHNPRAIKAFSVGRARLSNG